jgi:putative redox protein
MIMQISFPGGLKADAAFKGFTVRTDQPLDHGGDATAPTPFSLFLASIGTCAGLNVLAFCQKRGLSTDGLGLTMENIKDPESSRTAVIRLEIQLPEGFPEKYREAVIRAADQCTVKKHILEPPHFEVVTLAPTLAGV